MNIPLQIYDFIAVLFPSTLILLIAKQELPNIGSVLNGASSSNFGGLAVAFVLLYIFGQAVSLVVGRLERWKWTKWVWYEKSKTVESGETKLRGRKTEIVLPEKTATALLGSLKEFYGFEVTADEPNLFELVYAPVQDKMDKRDMFLSLANMMRSVTIVCFVYGTYLFLKFMLHLFFGIPWVLNDYFFTVSCVVGYMVFKHGYRNNTYLSEIIPFTAFLSWYKQRGK